MHRIIGEASNPGPGKRKRPPKDDMHLFFANEKIPSYPCKEGGLDAAKKLGVCPDVWRRFPESYLRLSEIT